MYVGDQLWTCSKCGCERKWGEGRPQQNNVTIGKPSAESLAVTYLPLLNCRVCKATTRHNFKRVDFDYLASLDRAKQSPLPYRFDDHKSYRRSVM